MDQVPSVDEGPPVVNRENLSYASPDELGSDCSGGSSGPPGSPSITSRLSLLKLGSVIAKFSDFKKNLVREIGFDGLLLIKSWQKINLKYSSYLMDRVDVDSCIINLDGQGMLELSDKQVQHVFAIPLGEKNISSEGVEPSEACIEYSRFAASLGDKGTHSLKAAEAYLLRDISAESKKIEVECFKIAFVIFAVGHVLAPSSKHDYISIDFWAAINDVSKIRDWNWCGYLLKHLFQGVRKFKTDVTRRNTTIHIVGCHLVLQVFVLDSLELGSLNKARGMFPRIALFDYDSMKKMIEAISVNMGGGEISFHGASVRQNLNISKEIVCAPRDDVNLNKSRASPNSKKLHTPSTPIMRSNYGKCGPLEFSNHLRTKYPSVSGEKLGILLREHNARGLANISEMRQSFQNSMFTLADKIISCISENCTCCKANGRRQCILKSEEQSNANISTVPNREEEMFVTPISNKIVSRLSAPVINEGSSSANSSIARKRAVAPNSSNEQDSSKKICVRQDTPLQMVSPSAIDTVNNSSLSAKQEARNEVANLVYSFFDDLTAVIVTYYAELRPRADYVTFGTTNDIVPTKIRLPQCNLARDPWAIGSVPLPPSTTVLNAIKEWLSGSSTLLLERDWIVHPHPRLVSIDGAEIQQQLAGSEQLGHEMASVIYRRLHQMDFLFTKDSAGMIWRKFMEPEFATAVLSNADPLTIQSIRTSFTSALDKWNPASTRVWHIPAILPDGWAVYSFDMLKKRISVLDPAVGPFGFSNRRVNMHTYVSNILHSALFRCLQSLYESWHCSCGEWTRSFPILMVEKVDKEDYGICATFLARNFNGDKLQIPLTKANLGIHKNLMLYEVMRLQGNESLIPHDAIEAIKGSFVVI